MQFLYRLGAVVIWLTLFPLLLYWGWIVIGGFAEAFGLSGTLAVVATLLAGGLAAYSAVLVWRWVCGQEPKRSLTHPRTHLDRVVAEFVRKNPPHKARPLDLRGYPSIKDLRREPRLIDSDEQN